MLNKILTWSGDYALHYVMHHNDLLPQSGQETS